MLAADVVSFSALLLQLITAVQASSAPGAAKEEAGEDLDGVREIHSRAEDLAAKERIVYTSDVDGEWIKDLARVSSADVCGDGGAWSCLTAS